MTAHCSTGPKTETGKANSSMNAVKHGLCAEAAVLEGENSVDYEALKSGLEGRLAPEGDLEEELVRRIVDAAWRLRRAVRVENLELTYNMDKAKGADERLSDMPYHIPDHHMARAFRITQITVLGRYESRIEKSMFKSLDILEKYQNARRRLEREAI